MAALGVAVSVRLASQVVEGPPKLRSLIRIKGESCPYRVERLDGDRIELRMMWKYLGAWRLEKADKPPRWRTAADISWQEVLETAPEPGSKA
jgi:hypothetical protein